MEEIVRPGGQGAVVSFPGRSVLPGSGGLGVAGDRASEAEIGRLALEEFLRDCQLEFQERFQRGDGTWALDQKGAAG